MNTKDLETLLDGNHKSAYKGNNKTSWMMLAVWQVSNVGQLVTV